MHSSNTLSLLLAAFSGYASALPHYAAPPVPGVPGDHHPPGPRGPPNPPPPPSPSAP
ncbi:triacylglycerol lipase V precursor, partial [Fusarium agapanthi]